MTTVTLLLPAAARLGGQALPAGLAKALGRADSQRAEAGERAQLRRHFRLVPGHWPVAALTRQLDAGDAEGATWLRADPAFIRPDMNGARMFSHGEALGLSDEDSAQLLPALKPLFGDAGCLLDAPDPSRWYLRLSPEMPLPSFAPPEDVLGDDLFAHLPQGPEGRRWRALLTEAQVILHQHPWNVRRLAQGKPSVNSLWFWGAGSLPQAVQTPFRQVRSSDALLRALAKQAGVPVEDAAGEVDALVDLRHLRSLELLARDALQPLLAEVMARRLQRLDLDFEDGSCFSLSRGQRWRLWKRPLQQLGG